MSKTLQECDVIQSQHLADVHVVRQKGQFVGRISEEKVALFKAGGVKELEALPVPALSTKHQLNENSLKEAAEAKGQRRGFLGQNDN